MVYERLYNELQALVVDWDFSYLKFEAGEGFMPLVIEKLTEDDEQIVISMTHYFKQNGDLIPDPDMEIRVKVKDKVAEALSFRDQYSYRQVYHGKMINLQTKRELNWFLQCWLKNIKAQGYQLRVKEKES